MERFSNNVECERQEGKIVIYVVGETFPCFVCKVHIQSQECNFLPVLFGHDNGHSVCILWNHVKQVNQNLFSRKKADTELSVGVLILRLLCIV